MAGRKYALFVLSMTCRSQYEFNYRFAGLKNYSNIDLCQNSKLTLLATDRNNFLPTQRSYSMNLREFHQMSVESNLFCINYLVPNTRIPYNMLFGQIPHRQTPREMPQRASTLSSIILLRFKVFIQTIRFIIIYGNNSTIDWKRWYRYCS